MDDLTGRVAVITGGANGIGLGTALALARRGAKLVLVDISPPDLDKAVAAVAAQGGDVIGFRGDVSDDATFPALRTRTLQAYGRVDIVMNNAGVISNGVPTEIPVEEWRRVFDINFMSIVRSNQVFLPDLIAQGSGHVVNTASFAALYPYAYDRLPYATSKAAVVSISEGMALYLKPQGVGVTVLCPGPVQTQIRRTLKQWGDPPIPLRGLPARFERKQPEEVGEMVAEAIIRDIFFLPTDPQIHEILREQVRDREAFIAAQVAEVAANPTFHAR